MIEYIVFDTNVLVSYLLSVNSGSSIKYVVDQIFTGTVIPVYSLPMIEEYEEVLGRKKFKFHPELVQILLDTIIDNGIRVSPISTNEPFLDQDDKCFYDTAVTAHANWLITGNKKHFPDEPFIVTAAEYLERTQKRV